MSDHPGPQYLVCGEPDDGSQWKPDTLTIQQALERDADPYVSWAVGTSEIMYSDLATALDYCEDYGDRLTLYQGADKPTAAELFDDLMSTIHEWSDDYWTTWGWASILDQGGEPDGCRLDDNKKFQDALLAACEAGLESFDPERSPRSETNFFITFTPELEAAVLEAAQIRTNGRGKAATHSRTRSVRL